MLQRAIVVGTGLIGTSVALALREGGVEVALSDPDTATLELACELGAGNALDAEAMPAPADIAVIAAPPRAVAAVLRDIQDRGLAHVHTDCASVKDSVVREATRIGCDLATFVPGHPMGGREKHGPSAARADLFLGRSWAVCPTGKTDPGAVATVTELARLCGAEPLTLDAAHHDGAVALTSHAPHVASSAVAARMVGGDDTALTLAGQGVRDVTRVAGGDPLMWQEILRHNAVPVADIVESIAIDLASVADALRAGENAPIPTSGTGDSASAVRELLERGRQGHDRIPGKRGARPAPGYATLPVVIPDEPDALGRLFAAAGAAGVNIEDVRIDHSPGLPVGVAQLYVQPEVLGELAEVLAGQGWSVHA